MRTYVTDAALRILAKRRKRLPTRDDFCKCMRDAVDAGEPLSKVLRMATDEATAGGSAATTPAPGDDYTAKAPSFMPNALGNISAFSRASTTQPSLTLGQTFGTREPAVEEGEEGESYEQQATRAMEERKGDTADAMIAKMRSRKATSDTDRAYFSANSRMQSAIAQINARNQLWHDTATPDKPLGDKPTGASSTYDRPSIASDSNGPMRFSGHTTITTAAEINRRNRAHKWGS
jgi:hypothetical protein